MANVTAYYYTEEFFIPVLTKIEKKLIKSHKDMHSKNNSLVRLPKELVDRYQKAFDAWYEELVPFLEAFNQYLDDQKREL